MLAFPHHRSGAVRLHRAPLSPSRITTLRWHSASRVEGRGDGRLCADRACPCRAAYL